MTTATTKHHPLDIAAALVHSGEAERLLDSDFHDAYTTNLAYLQVIPNPGDSLAGWLFIDDYTTVDLDSCSRDERIEGVLTIGLLSGLVCKVDAAITRDVALEADARMQRTRVLVGPIIAEQDEDRLEAAYRRLAARTSLIIGRDALARYRDSHDDFLPFYTAFDQAAEPLAQNYPGLATMTIQAAID